MDELNDYAPHTHGTTRGQCTRRSPFPVQRQQWHPRRSKEGLWPPTVAEDGEMAEVWEGGGYPEVRGMTELARLWICTDADHKLICAPHARCKLDQRYSVY
ncbi:unnamed protein product [Penicillium roqueforti FM164]|uniref:Genomic scaffold, ProqFM164S03 n=1 Tax=Penicillium roqueforti (strain FM164) TaxID=1365484 RepID=W6QJ26_PENRF|nr:unnamed protein product [Penicillium roqueforti FM164]